MRVVSNEGSNNDLNTPSPEFRRGAPASDISDMMLPTLMVEEPSIVTRKPESLAAAAKGASVTLSPPTKQF